MGIEWFFSLWIFFYALFSPQRSWAIQRKMEKSICISCIDGKVSFFLLFIKFRGMNVWESFKKKISRTSTRSAIEWWMKLFFKCGVGAASIENSPFITLYYYISARLKRWPLHLLIRKNFHCLSIIRCDKQQQFFFQMRYFNLFKNNIGRINEI